MKKDPISKSLNLRLSDGFNNIMRKCADPDAIVNPTFVLKQVVGDYKPHFKKRSTLIKLNDNKLTNLCIYNYN